MQQNRAKSFFPAALLLACISIDAVHAADPLDEIRTCAKVVNSDARLACYDSLGEQVLAGDRTVSKPAPKTVVQAEPAEQPTAASTTPSLPDSIGGGEFEEQPKKTKAKTSNQGLITSCKKGPDSKWYFYFDNGQVWKQTNSDKLYFRSCEFVATITRDAFGFKMQIEGKKRKIRVSRKK